ncbi:hypothetical protein [Oceanibaculum pacificum]|uniref:Uncharacterized protein n=1 Tax=Oceanibaculum pacificum TaxID=580166 RepID=A0A154VJ81_9PROT|nr:hypothetical protein [Oceanibaculum pacificum]KZD01356.1 hypothetical protein AUP43_13910 [Oceanibaculum pacificum]
MAIRYTLGFLSQPSPLDTPPTEAEREKLRHLLIAEIEEGMQQIEHGESVSWEEFEAEMDRRIADIERKEAARDRGESA